MKIIGHRGARGTQLENSLASIEQALTLDLDAIEFDIHRTKDDVLVVMHDATTKRTAGEDVRIADVTYAELQAIRLKNGQEIPTAEAVLRLAGKRLIYIDIKDSGTVSLLVQLLKKYPDPEIVVVSSLVDELLAIKKLRPQTPTYLYFYKKEHPIIRPIWMVRESRRAQAHGLAMDRLLINPLTYWLACRQKLEMYVYPISSLRMARFFLFLYPTMDIATSHPEAVNRSTLHR